jgi:ABC-type multidrug transport system fused ATPase/permease subunit
LAPFHAYSSAYLAKLLRFCLARHPVLVANTALALVSVLLELAAMASVLPLSLLATGEKIPPDSAWGQVYRWLAPDPGFATGLLLFLALFALRLLTQFANQSVAVHAGKRVQAELGARAFGAIARDLSLKEIDEKTSGYFMSLAGDEAARSGNLVLVLNQIIGTALLAGLYFAAVWAYSWRLGLFVTAFIAVVMAGLRSTLQKAQRLGERQALESRVVNSVFLDALTGLRSVRALSAEAFVIAKYESLLHDYTRTHFFIEVLRFTAKLIPALILLLCVGGAALAGRLQAATPQDLAVIVTGLAFLLRFFPAAGEVLSTFMYLLTYLRGAADVTELASTPSATAGQAPGLALQPPVHTLEFRQVCFGYGPGRPVMEDFSATLRSGRSYAVVGASGSGKTTFFDLLLGFYAPDRGEVCVNGMPLQRIDNPSLRARIALVGQQVAIFNDSISGNVRFGAEASEQQVRAACQAACVEDFIQALPERYETLLSFQGSNLSGGQRQRIGIARGLLRDAEVLLLDECTAGLDPETRDRVVGNILRLYRDRIVVFATHDREVASQVDEVLSLPQRAAASEALA